MVTSHRALAAITLLLAGCDGTDLAPEQEDWAHPAAEMQRSAEQIWSRAGRIVTVDGTESLFPRTDAQWSAADEAARNLLRLGSQMKRRGSRPADPLWITYSEDLVSASNRIRRSVAERDQHAFFAAAGALYDSCSGCHESYITRPE